MVNKFGEKYRLKGFNLIFNYWNGNTPTVNRFMIPDRGNTLN
jgi:hypothetical protein